jgi:hypothetical protein
MEVLEARNGANRGPVMPEILPSPPFGSAEYVLRTPLYLKQGHKLFEAFSYYPLYSNAAISPHTIDQRKKVPNAYQKRNPGESVL